MHDPMFDARNAQGEQEREGCSRHERGHEHLLPRRNTAEAGGTRSSRPFQFTRNPNVAYLTIDVGGPYRSDDGCRTWRPLHGNLPYEMRLKGRSGDGGRRRDMARIFAGTAAPGAGDEGLGQLWRPARTRLGVRWRGQRRVGLPRRGVDLPSLMQLANERRNRVREGRGGACRSGGATVRFGRPCGPVARNCGIMKPYLQTTRRVTT